MPRRPGKPYTSIVDFYEECFQRYGGTHRGVGYTKSLNDVEDGYRVMLELLREPPHRRVSLLDFGCGLAHFLEYLQREGERRIEYSGLDVSDKFLSLARKKFPDVQFYDLDVLDENDAADLPTFDYVIMNGVFTVKATLPFEEMWTYFTQVISNVFKKTRCGLAFNLMSKYVEWERDDLFHVPFDSVASFLIERLSRKVVLRHDYRPHEYTAYVYR